MPPEYYEMARNEDNEHEAEEKNQSVIKAQVIHMKSSCPS